MLPLVSIIVPCYNHSCYVRDAINSVIQQDYKNYECLIINDGSTDDSENVILQEIINRPQFSYYSTENSGLSKSRNYGISKARGKYILPLDSDDKLDRNYVSSCVREIEKNNDIKLVYGNSFFFGLSKKEFQMESYTFDKLLFRNMIHCTGMFRKDDWYSVGGYDENLKNGLEDWEFWISLLKNGGEVIKLENANFYYRVKEQSMIKDVINDDYGYNSRVYIFNKHKDVYMPSGGYDLFYENFKLKSFKNNLKENLTFLEVCNLMFKVSINSALKKFRKITTKFQEVFYS